MARSRCDNRTVEFSGDLNATNMPSWAETDLQCFVMHADLHGCGGVGCAVKWAGRAGSGGGNTVDGGQKL